MRHRGRPLVHREAGQRGTAVADRADHEVGPQHLRLAGADRAPVAVHGGPLHLDAVHPLLAEQPHRPGEELQPQRDPSLLGNVVDPAAHGGHVAGDVAVGGQALLGLGVELQVSGVHEHRRAGHLAELAQLLGGEARLRGAAAAEHGDLLDGRGGEHVEHVLRHLRRVQLRCRPGEHPGDVQGDVAHPDDDHRAGAAAAPPRPGRDGRRDARSTS